MELHAKDGILGVPDAHDLAFVGLGGNLKESWQSVALNHEGMVAGRKEWIRHAGKKIFAIVLNRRSLPMHHPVIHHHLGPKSVPDALMPQANSQERQLRTELTNDVI